LNGKISKPTLQIGFVNLDDEAKKLKNQLGFKPFKFHKKYLIKNYV